MKISDNVLNVLEASETRDGMFYLPNYKLERKLYQDVNKVLEILGGKWNRKAKVHVFEIDPGEAIDEARSVCRLGQMEKCCAFLVCGMKGFECIKYDYPANASIHSRLEKGTMNAKGEGEWEGCTWKDYS